MFEFRAAKLVFFIQYAKKTVKKNYSSCEIRYKILLLPTENYIFYANYIIKGTQHA